jgi:hypothetical protein
VHPPAHERQTLVPSQGSREQARLAQDLEAVADAHHRAAPLGVLPDGVHHPSEPGDGSGPEVITVGEATRKDDGIGTGQVIVAVPDRHRLSTHQLDGP